MGQYVGTNQPGLVWDRFVVELLEEVVESLHENPAIFNGKLNVFGTRLLVRG